MRIVRFLSLGIYLSLIALTSAGVQADTRLEIVYGENGYPPFYWFEDGRPAGMFADFIDSFQRENPRFTFDHRRLPRVRMDREMRLGRSDAYSLINPRFIDESARMRYLYTGRIWRTGDYLYSRSDDVIRYRSPEDLFDCRLGVIRGNGYGVFDQYFADRRIETVTVDTDRQLLLLLRSGRIDAFIGNRHTTRYRIVEAGMSPDWFHRSQQPILEFDLVMGIQPERADFHRAMNEHIQRMAISGELDVIADRYVSEVHR
jgi:hypothetical protein